MVHLTFDDDGEPVDEFAKRKPHRNVLPILEDERHDQWNRGYDQLNSHSQLNRGYVQPNRGYGQQNRKHDHLNGDYDPMRTFLDSVKQSVYGESGGNEKTPILFDNDDQLDKKSYKKDKNASFISNYQEESQSKRIRPSTSDHLYSDKKEKISKNEKDGEINTSASQHRKSKKKSKRVLKEQQFTFEENKFMTRYEGFWIQKAKVADLDCLKSSLEEQNLKAKIVS